jgi:hypothetical protein
MAVGVNGQPTLVAAELVVVVLLYQRDGVINPSTILMHGTTIELLKTVDNALDHLVAGVTVLVRKRDTHFATFRYCYINIAVNQII